MFAVLLATVLLLVALRLDRPDIAAPVRGFTFGMGATAGLLVVVDAIGKLVRRPYEGRAILLLATVAAVVASVIGSYAVLGSSLAAASAMVWWGAAAMLLAGGVVGLWKYLR